VRWPRMVLAARAPMPGACVMTVCPVMLIRYVVVAGMTMPMGMVVRSGVMRWSGFVA
jgi:hypothetical protein